MTAHGSMRLAFDSLDTPPGEVRERLHGAIRRGQPAWLWPEIDRDEWQDALRRIADALGAMLSHGSYGAPFDGDPAAFGLACYTSGTGPILGWWAEQGALAASPAIAAVLELHLRHNRLRAERLEAAAVAVVGSLAAAGIDVVILKGLHTAGAYFPEPGTRPAADIDLLIRADQRQAAEAELRPRGFVANGRSRFESGWRPRDAPAEPRSLWLAHADDPWSIDLHHSLDMAVGGGLSLAKFDLAGPMASRRPWHASPAAHVLDQPLLALHLAVHAGAGLQNLTLLRLVELQLVIRKDQKSGRLSWGGLLDLAERTGSLGYAYPALRLCDELAHGAVPATVLDRCAAMVPRSAMAVLNRLTLATAHRVDRSSLAEHFMWVSGWRERLGQVALDVAVSRSWRTLWRTYERRAWQVLRGKVGR